ncbi:MAG: hypothetical protein ACKVOK_11955 [Flavobacteriales bacterium]
MKAIRITYAVALDFVEQNSRNIQEVMRSIEEEVPSGIAYHACLNPDGVTFVHTAFFEDEDVQKKLNTLPAFQKFQAALKSHNPEFRPAIEQINLIGFTNKLTPWIK